MKNSFKKYLIGLSVFVLFLTLSCSKRESSSTSDAQTQQASSSYTNAQNTLQSIGLAISIPTMSDFADTTSTSKSSALTSIFSGNDGNTAAFDTTKFAGLESAISDLQSSLSSYTSAPKGNLSLNPSLVSESWKSSDLTYIHFLLGYYYTVHAVLKLRCFIEQGIVVVSGTRYGLAMEDKTLADLADSGRQAILDAYFMLNGVRYQVNNNAGTGKIYANKNLPAGTSKTDLLTGNTVGEGAAYHLDMAIYYAGDVFPQLKTALTKMQSDSFQEFFDELATKMTNLGITELAAN